MTSQFTDAREMLRQLEAKQHCACEGRPLHGHCVTCNAHLPEGESKCSACKERERRRRSCLICHEEFYLPAVKDEVSPQRLGFCSEQCYEADVRQKLERTGVPPRYLDCTLAGFNAYTERLAEKVRLVQNWATSELETGLYLFGSVGTGKTHLAVGLMRALVKRGFRGEFVTARSFIMRCQTAFGRKESAEEIVGEILGHTDFLILDDLGSEKATDYVRQSMPHLIDECYNRQITLVVTSNVDFEALNQLDERISSRLMEMCDRIKFSEADYRAQIAKSRPKVAARMARGGADEKQTHADAGTVVAPMAEGRP